MHIALNGWFWNQPHTGTGQLLRELVRALPTADSTHTYSVVLPPGADATDAPDGVTLVPTRGGVPGKAGKVWFEQQQFPASVRRLRADVAHVPYWGPPLSVDAPLVVSVLDVIPLLFPEYTQGAGVRLYTALVRAATPGAAEIITLSEASKRDVVAQLGVPAERVTAVPLAAGERFHPRLGAERDAAVRAKYDLPDEFVLYLGGYDARKRVAQLVHAYSYVARARGGEVPLVLAGREPQYDDALFPNVRRIVDELGLADNVLWLGAVDEADKPSLYRLARVFAYPSAYEGFGLPLIEAMACGTPVVANNIPVFDEVTRNGAYLVEDGNATQMGGALLAILEQPDLHDSVANAGLGVATGYRWRNTARATVEVYARANANTGD